MGPALTELEQAVLPLAAPLLGSLWANTLMPAIQAKLKSGSPEIQLIETELVTMLQSLVPAELAKLTAG